MIKKNSNNEWTIDEINNIIMIDSGPRGVKSLIVSNIISRNGFDSAAKWREQDFHRKYNFSHNNNKEIRNKINDSENN